MIPHFKQLHQYCLHFGAKFEWVHDGSSYQWWSQEEFTHHKECILVPPLSQNICCFIMGSSRLIALMIQLHQSFLNKQADTILSMTMIFLRLHTKWMTHSSCHFKHFLPIFICFKSVIFYYFLIKENNTNQFFMCVHIIILKSNLFFKNYFDFDIFYLFA